MPRVREDLAAKFIGRGGGSCWHLGGLTCRRNAAPGDLGGSLFEARCPFWVGDERKTKRKTETILVGSNEILREASQKPGHLGELRISCFLDTGNILGSPRNGLGVNENWGALCTGKWKGLSVGLLKGGKLDRP